MSAAVAATNATANLDDEIEDNLLVTDATKETHRAEGLSPELVATSEAVNVSTATPQRGSISISPSMWGERTALDAHAFWERTALDGIGPTA